MRRIEDLIAALLHDSPTFRYVIITVSCVTCRIIPTVAPRVECLDDMWRENTTAPDYCSLRYVKFTHHSLSVDLVTHVKFT
jgi:hypothetical protein